MAMMTTTASSAAKNCSLACARQSASAVDVRVVATIRMGKFVSDLTAPTRSSASTVLLKRPEMLPFSASARWNDGDFATF